VSRDAAVRSEILSINVVEPLPTLILTLSNKTGTGASILVDGMTPPTAAALDWIDIVGRAIALGEKLIKGGGGGGGDGCTTITITNPDGSSTSIKTCPKPQ